VVIDEFLLCKIGKKEFYLWSSSRACWRGRFRCRIYWDCDCRCFYWSLAQCFYRLLMRFTVTSQARKNATLPVNVLLLMVDDLVLVELKGMAQFAVIFRHFDWRSW